MTDQELWEEGVAAIAREYAALGEKTLEVLRPACVAIRAAKERLHELFTRANCDESCRLCAWACCARGKYHFTVVDLLVYLDAGQALFIPRFDSGTCPFLSGTGCLMSPSFRPYACTTFICDTVDEALSSAEREFFYRVGAELRATYGQVEGLFAGRFMYGLLINSERRLREGGGAILGTKPRA
ncbi:MAG TPA: hypothetical protein VIU40_01950 [Geobacteraceae bacterium]